MNNLTRILRVVCGAGLVAVMPLANAATIDYSNTTSSTINFNPLDDCGTAGSVGCFDFTPNSSSSGTTTSLQITSGSASGSLGTIDGVFGVGAITSTATPAGPVETAAVSGTGTLTIIDSGSNALTADLDWIDVFSIGALGGANVQASANLSSISYSGSDTDLLALFNGGSGAQTLTYQFGTGTSLTDLFENSSTTTSTSFSGSINAVPVPAAIWLFGSGLIGLVGMSRRKKST